ncbi:MAG: hypothetical protein GY798_26345 [Hyphomicrobiales bacterium]|nr:hypothetical protein [Hyphomicrobiales bacterium]
MTRQISIEALKRADRHARRIQKLVDGWLHWEAFPCPYPHLKADHEAQIRKQLFALTTSIDTAARKQQ